MNNNIKKLIIVCEEDLRLYGDFLAQLISGNDDDEEKVVGLKDGAAGALVWSEKEYVSNSPQISSEQYLLFIGNSKVMKDKRRHMQSRYSEFGMNYGWLGKQAALYVDSQLSYDEYGSFYEILKGNLQEGNQLEAVRLLPANTTNKVDDALLLERTVKVDSEDIIVAEDNNEEKGLAKFLAPARNALKKTADIGLDAINKVSHNINAVTKGKEIEEQQYTCAVLMFYLKDLSVFLGVKEG